MNGMPSAPLAPPDLVRDRVAVDDEGGDLKETFRVLDEAGVFERRAGVLRSFSLYSPFHVWLSMVNMRFLT
jgi:hypothetical protein